MTTVANCDYLMSSEAMFTIKHKPCCIYDYSTGATLEIITDRSQEGAQFVKGFGGIGGMVADMFLHYVSKVIVKGLFSHIKAY